MSYSHEVRPGFSFYEFKQRRVLTAQHFDSHGTNIKVNGKNKPKDLNAEFYSRLELIIEDLSEKTGFTRVHLANACELTYIVFNNSITGENRLNPVILGMIAANGYDLVWLFTGISSDVFFEKENVKEYMDAIKMRQESTARIQLPLAPEEREYIPPVTETTPEATVEPEIVTPEARTIFYRKASESFHQTLSEVENWKNGEEVEVWALQTVRQIKMQFSLE